MRITAEAKAETRQRIIDAATRLFTTDGWETTTTRSIAAEAGIAAGTLFNYFQTKEAIVAMLITEAFKKAEEELQDHERDEQSIEEELFSLIWTELSSLRQFKKFLPAAAETIFSPMRRAAPDSPGESIRVKHLEAVEQIIVRAGVGAPLPPITMQLYWTLYLGVFAYWAADESPKQEDTLALLDQSLQLFVASLRLGREGEGHGERQSEGSHRSASARRKRGPRS